MASPKDTVAKSCCETKPAISRREFVQSSLGAGLFAAYGGLALSPKMVFAQNPGQQLIPVDKGLAVDWLASLTERDSAEIYREWEELQYIGMPVGGMGCGQLYLGGDGQLWHWDIFKSNYERDPDHGEKLDSLGAGGHYAHPVSQGELYTKRNGADVKQGFAIEVQQLGKRSVRTLNHDGFTDVSFRGEYPIGKVSYQDSSLPVGVELEAFSPFIPGEAQNSALPATVMSFTVSNTSKSAVTVKLLGWLQNAVCPYLRDPKLGERVNQVVVGEKSLSMLSEAKGVSGRQDLAASHGFGSMALSVLNSVDTVKITAAPQLHSLSQVSELFNQVADLDLERHTLPLDQELVGGLQGELELQPGESKTIEFLITWYFPDYAEYSQFSIYHFYGPDEFSKSRRHYASQFTSALEVASHIANHSELMSNTRLWNKVWYDSTLPHWLLDRTFIAINCMATQMFHWFDNGRPYAWEGVDCCPGTCTHVWHYAQGLSRMFPELERLFRERIDFGVGFNEETGEISARGEIAVEKTAVDGHAGTILRVYREHQISKDSDFLTRLWPKVKLSIEFLMAQDTDESGLLRGHQYNTLDAAWYGPMGWISSLYLAALRAAEAMAAEMGDLSFSSLCQKRVEVGQKNLVAELFNGEYFIHKPDPAYPSAIRSGIGCHIDQVLGQAWTHQVGLASVIPKAETLSALNSLWDYNFAPDAGQYAVDNIAIEPAFRTYADPGEAGLVMCSWPNGGAEEAIPDRKWFGLMEDTPKYRTAENPKIWTGPGGYFNECMNGFEYQVAWHMIAEGESDDALVKKGLAITRAVHDRYGAEKRNPYNEVECSDHYARSMASYGIFIAVCGFTYHGPKGQIGFAPKVNPNDFKSAFTGAEGWGSFEQTISDSGLSAVITLHHGLLAIRQVTLRLPSDIKPTGAACNGLAVEVVSNDGKVVLLLGSELMLKAGGSLDIKITV